jgi:hypothetical protein
MEDDYEFDQDDDYYDSDDPGDIKYHQEDWEEEDEFESSGRHQLHMPRWETKVWKSLASASSPVPLWEAIQSTRNSFYKLPSDVLLHHSDLWFTRLAHLIQTVSDEDFKFMSIDYSLGYFFELVYPDLDALPSTAYTKTAWKAFHKLSYQVYSAYCLKQHHFMMKTQERPLTDAPTTAGVLSTSDLGSNSFPRSCGCASSLEVDHLLMFHVGKYTLKVPKCWFHTQHQSMFDDEDDEEQEEEVEGEEGEESEESEEQEQKQGSSLETIFQTYCSLNDPTTVVQSGKDHE